LTNVISDPLGTILQALLGSFDPVFLAFALITGYLTFFLFFYGTKKWKSIDWVERFFFGFLFGMFSSLVFVACLYVPIVFILVTTYSENVANLALYAGPLLFLALLCGLRIYFKVPLCSPEIKNKFFAMQTNQRMYLPILLLIFSFVLIIGILLNNPFFSYFNTQVWLGFLFYLNFGLFGYVILMSTFLLCLASLSSDLHPLKFLFSTMRWYCGFANGVQFYFETKNKSELQKIYDEQKKLSKKMSIRCRLSKSTKTPLFKAVIIAFLICILFISLDRSLGIVSPSIQIVDSTASSDPVYVEAYRYYNGSFIYLEKMTQTYWIRLPIISLRNFNLSVSNPSNLTSDDTENINTLYMSRVGVNVVCNNSFVYDLRNDGHVQVQSIDVMPVNSSSQSKATANITVAYYNKLDWNLIEISEPTENHLDNGSVLVSMSLSIDNPEQAQVSFQRLPIIPLYYFNDLGNITSFSWEVSGSQVGVSSDYQNSDSWIWSPSFNIFPSQVEHIDVKAVFEASK
jgi:hypothetical protein